MTLVLRSNVTASRSLGNAYGVNAPRDWVASMDFTNDRHLLSSGGAIQNIDPADYVNCEREGTSLYWDRLGIVNRAAPDTIRIGRQAPNGPLGLLTEPERRIVYTTPFDPVTKTVEIQTSASDVMVVDCRGSGSVTISGDIDPEQGGSVTATSGDLSVVELVTGTSSITFTVDGDVEYLGAAIVSGVRFGLLTPHDGLAAAGDRQKADYVSLALSEMGMDAATAGTILVEYAFAGFGQIKDLDRSYDPVQPLSVIKGVDDALSGSLKADRLTGARFLPSYISNSQDTGLDSLSYYGFEPTAKLGMAWSGTTYRVSANGLSGGESLPFEMQSDGVRFYAHPDFGIPYRSQLPGVIKRIIVYNRPLTKTELEAF